MRAAALARNDSGALLRSRRRSVRHRPHPHQRDGPRAAVARCVGGRERQAKLDAMQRRDAPTLASLARRAAGAARPDRERGRSLAVGDAWLVDAGLAARRSGALARATAPLRAPLRRRRHALSRGLIKLGQVASLRVDVRAGGRSRDELARLQDRVEPHAFAEIRAQVESELGGAARGPLRGLRRGAARVREPGPGPPRPHARRPRRRREGALPGNRALGGGRPGDDEARALALRLDRDRGPDAGLPRAARFPARARWTTCARDAPARRSRATSRATPSSRRASACRASTGT